MTNLFVRHEVIHSIIGSRSRWHATRYLPFSVSRKSTRSLIC